MLTPKKLNLQTVEHTAYGRKLVLEVWQEHYPCTEHPQWTIAWQLCRIVECTLIASGRPSSTGDIEDMKARIEANSEYTESIYTCPACARVVQS